MKCFRQNYMRFHTHGEVPETLFSIPGVLRCLVLQAQVLDKHPGILFVCDETSVGSGG